MEQGVGRGGVSVTPLGRVTSVIQFDHISAMVVPAFAHWEGRELNRGTMDTTSISAKEKASPPALTPTAQHPSVHSW